MTAPAGAEADCATSDPTGDATGGRAAHEAAADRQRRRLVAVLAVTQTVGYGALIQSFTVLLVPIARDLDASRTAVAAAMTISILVGAAAAVPVGRLLDRYGGRALMAGGSAVGVLAVVLWSQARTLPELYVAFALVGVALAMSTYEAAFAVLVVATDARRRDSSILVLTLVTGLLTSFYYPLTAWLDGLLGWRTALLVLAGSVAVLALPAHLWVVPGRAAHARRIGRREGVRVADALRRADFWLLLVAFATSAGVASAFLMLMVTYLRDVGFDPTLAASMPVTVGVMQITSRIALAPLARRFGMTRVTVVAFTLQATGLLALTFAGTAVVPTLLCIAAFGVGHGVSVVARPSIVADAFGVAQFASIVAVMTVPTALARAGAPLLGTWLGDSRFLLVMGLAGVVATAALVPLARDRTRARADEPVEAVPALAEPTR